MPEGFTDYREPDNWLKFGEINRLAKVMIAAGTRRIRLTGGEPLLRRNLPDLGFVCPPFECRCVM